MGLRFLLLAACASQAWQTSQHGLEVESRLQQDWTAVCAAYPPRGEVVFAVDVDVTGKPTEISPFQNTAGPDQARAARELLAQRAPYPSVAGQRVFIRFGMIGRVDVMEPTSDESGLKQRVQAKQPAYKECFRTAVGDIGDFAFVGTLNFVINDAGEPSDIEVASSAPVDPGFADCLRDETTTLRFPRHQYTGRVVRYPLRFEVVIKKRGR